MVADRRAKLSKIAYTLQDRFWESRLLKLKLKEFFPFLESSQDSRDVDFKLTIWTSPSNPLVLVV